MTSQQCLKYSKKYKNIRPLQISNHTWWYFKQKCTCIWRIFNFFFFYVNSYQCQTSRNPDEGHGQRDGVFWEEYPWQVTHRLLLAMLFLAGFSYLASYFSWVVQKYFKWTKGARQEFCKAWINSSDIQKLANGMARYRY